MPGAADATWDNANMSDDADDPAPHELKEFLRQDQAELVAEYQRIFARSTEDPGTAGDQGEENWATLLRDWLPAGYHVVTKGRILFTDRSASPQVDVVVLRPGYPERLLSKKLYLSSGVLAAFECKNTLKSEHITTAAKTAAQLKAISSRRLGTPRDELKVLPYYGLLAHSHSWKAPASKPRDNVDSAIAPLFQSLSRPSELLDVVCVADLGTWTASYFVECPRFWDTQTREARLSRGVRLDGQVSVSFMRFRPEMYGENDKFENPNPIAVFINSLLRELAWGDPNLRPIADYFRLAGLGGSSKSLGRSYGINEVLSATVCQRLDLVPPSMGPESFWDPWSFHGF
jgi:hypothetical protein